MDSGLLKPIIVPKGRKCGEISPHFCLFFQGRDKLWKMFGLCFEIVSNLSPDRSELTGTMSANLRQDSLLERTVVDMKLDIKQSISPGALKARLSGLFSKKPGKKPGKILVSSVSLP